ncbi:MAG: sodium-translocating pyrophosphatase [Candidatus Aureabacteria bacterium]|nr:sodium-translocating pyrophosphatase [Candidatus Auribacterota bacterium]
MATWAQAPETGQIGAQKLPVIFLIAPLASIAALVCARYFYKSMMKCPEGTDRMKEIASYVRSGARAYIRQQYKVVAICFVFAAVFFAFLAFGLHVQSKWVPFAFLTGGFFSGLCGFIGLKTATYASARTANAARGSLNSALTIAFRSGAVMGLVCVGLGLLDICIWFVVLNSIVKLTLVETTVTILCFGMGASTQALFARVGGGIFTKAADVGADLVGKIEAGIPEDDPRNPAAIADNVGDNVGDVAGMGADLYESYCGSILATTAIGVASFAAEPALIFNSIILPMVIAGVGTLLSIAGIFVVRSGEKATQKELLAALARGVNLSTIGITIMSFFLVWGLLGRAHIGLWISILAGLFAGWVIGKATEYYTSQDYSPTQAVSSQSLTGPATVIIEGISVGMLSTWPAVITVSVATLVAFACAGGFASPEMGMYGVGLAAVGMLSTLGITLATDAYGPIADNAGGNAEMSGLDPLVRERTDALDSLGNTTAATGKGYAIGSAALTALTLLAAYIEEVRIGLIRMADRTADKLVQIGGNTFDKITVQKANLAFFMEKFNITLVNPKVLVGLFLGSMMAFIFCALSMKAVGRAARRMVEEVRRQFKEIAGIMEGKATPDYAKCVEISTKGAQHEMMLPALSAIIIPIVVGLVLGVSGVMGFLAGATSTGFVLAIMLANSGGAWDNAKKYIEQGHHGGKGSAAHKAAVTGDTVGDPFKDTAGPSLNILIKLMCMVSVVVAGLVIKFSPQISRFLHMGSI